MATFTDGALPVHKATVVPRGMALGMVTQVTPHAYVHAAFQYLYLRVCAIHVMRILCSKRVWTVGSCRTRTRQVGV